METHLVNRKSGEENPFCGAEASDGECIGVMYYLRARLARSSVGTICEACKVQAEPLAREIIEAAVEEHEAEGRFDVAEDYYELGKTLARETGQDSLAG